MTDFSAKVRTSLEMAKAKCNAKLLTGCAVSSAAVAVSAVPAFASGSDPLPTIAITQDMLKPLVEGVIANIGAILPIGLGLFAIFLGIRIIPGLITSFVRMR